MATHESKHELKPELKPKLKRDTLSFSEVVAQSVANIAPSATPALIIPLVFASSGAGTWLAYAVATVAMIFMTAQINVFAKRSASPGALYTFASLGLGSKWGALSGWSLIIAYIFTAAATLAGFANYTGIVIDSLFHFQIGQISIVVLMLGSLILCWWVARQDIQLSTRLMLYLEFAAVGLIIFLAVMFFFHTGSLVDRDQISMPGVTARGLRMALVLALFSFVGFESATALGEEAKNPLTSIPKSVLFSVLLVGVFFTAVAYTLVFAFKGNATTLDKSASPLVDLANITGLPKLGIPLAIGALIGQLSCTLASLTAAARVMYSMSKQNFFPEKIGHIHETHSTPHVAVFFAAIATGLPAIALAIKGTAVMDIFGYLGSISVFGFLLSYVLISVAAPVYLRRRNELRSGALLTSIITIVLLLVPIVGSVYPVPDAPYNYLPYIFVVLMLAGAARIMKAAPQT